MKPQRTDERLQENMRDHKEFYDMFCRGEGNPVKLCSLYGDERLCPVRCDYAIQRAREDLLREREGR